MQIRHSNRQLYFSEQEITTSTYVIPFLEKLKPVLSGMRVLEIGCGEGGNLKPFLERGCRVTGVDMSENKISLARSFFGALPAHLQPELICEDIYNLPSPAEKFDLVLMRDVIEHIHEQKRFMSFVRQFMHHDSLFFLAFPPWQNPFGGHQQVCRNKILSVLPYYHLLPVPLYRTFLRIAGESRATIDNLLEIKETGLSIERFRKIITGYRVEAEKFFLVNPNYEVKFGLKPVPQCRWISGIPYVRDILSTSAYYILSPEISRQNHQAG